MANKDQNAWMNRVLGTTLGGTAPVVEPVLDVQAEKAELEELGLGIVDLWDSAVDAFESAADAVDAQITALQLALRETDDPDLHDIADAGLNAITENTRVPLKAAVMDATGGPLKLKAATPKLLKAIDAFRTRLASEEVKACDRNPFGVPVSIADTYAPALERLAYVAKLAA